LSELSRILRPKGYLILREHDCGNDETLAKKYLNFVHAIMMIARVGEFAHQHTLHGRDEVETNSWADEKLRIIDYTKTIHYRSCDTWQTMLTQVGFRHCATLHYGSEGSSNPQKLFYAVYQLHKT
jgi:hypothetical protein